MKPSHEQFTVILVPWPTVLHEVGFFLSRNVGRAQRFFLQYRAGSGQVLKKVGWGAGSGGVEVLKYLIGYFQVLRVDLIFRIDPICWIYPKCRVIPDTQQFSKLNQVGSNIEKKFGRQAGIRYLLGPDCRQLSHCQLWN